MFRSRTEKLFIIAFVALILIIPGGSLLLSQRLKTPSAPSTQSYNRQVTSSPNEVPAQNALDTLRNSLNQSSNTTSSDESGSSSAQPQYGPGLNLKISIEGRSANDNHTKLFVGIAAGGPADSPQYLLSFNVDVPASGEYSGISLVGLTQGSTYTAYLKGSAQLVKAVSFTAVPTGVNLNGGNAISLITGDLNEDNVIDQADYNLAKSVYGATPGSSKWNANMDLNLDGIINNLDLSLIQNNLGKTGDSGKWYSPAPTPNASSSANLITPPNIGGTGGGHWEWVPDLGI